MKARIPHLLVLLLILAACGGQPTDNAPTPDTSPAATAQPAATSPDGTFTVTLSGLTDAQFAGTGLYACDEAAEVLSSGTAGTGNALSFVLPPSISAGEYALAAEDTTLFALLTAVDVPPVVQQSGTLILDSAPDAADDPVAGRFDLTFATEAGEVLQAVGVFDFTATSACG